MYIVFKTTCIDKGNALREAPLFLTGMKILLRWARKIPVMGFSPPYHSIILAS